MYWQCPNRRSGPLTISFLFSVYNCAQVLVSSYPYTTGDETGYCLHATRTSMSFQWKETLSAIKKKQESGSFPTTTTAMQTLYELADINCKGQLAYLAIEAHESGQLQELDTAILKKIRPMLYNEGEGDWIPLEKVMAQRHRERTGLPPSMLLLAERLLFHFPNIINDFYVNDEFYGQTVLHMTIIAEDPQMLRFLLKNGADPNARCSGNFFTCTDQKESRSDFSDLEHPVVQKHTNYKGHLYWGETPLSFSACLSQRDCFRMLSLGGADINEGDSNGNTVLHICTIRDNWEMFKLALSLGGNLSIQNRQQLTPLTLAAYLGNKQMFDRISEKLIDVQHTVGPVRTVAFPIEHNDTINGSNGQLDTHSSIYLAIHGNKNGFGHLLPGYLEQLVKKKWNHYAEAVFWRSFTLYLLYISLVFICSLLRFSSISKEDEVVCLVRLPDVKWKQVSGRVWIHHIINIICVSAAIMYLWEMKWNAKKSGRVIYWNTLKLFPSLLLFALSCLLILFSFICRLMCFHNAEKLVWITVLFLTPMRLGYYLQGMKSFGPFYLILWEVIKTDGLKFLLFFGGTVMAFSQVFYIIFLGYRRKLLYSNPNMNLTKEETPIMTNVFNSIAHTVLISIVPSIEFVTQMNKSPLRVLGELSFIVFALFVFIWTIALILSSMYTIRTKRLSINQLWLRQLSAIVLYEEMKMDNNKRLQYLTEYSTRLRGTPKRVVMIRTLLTPEFFDFVREKEAEHRKRFREAKQRREMILSGENEHKAIDNLKKIARKISHPIKKKISFNI